MKIERMLLCLCPAGLIGPVGKLVAPVLQKKAKKRSEELLAQWQADNAAVSSGGKSIEDMSVLLRSWGVPYTRTAVASIPETDLSAIFDVIQKKFSSPMVGVHVGNFVGVSLGYIATRLKAMSEENVLISLDPNMTFHGVSETEKMVTKLLRALDVQDVVIRLNGYSLGKTMSNDGYTVDGYDPFKHYLEEDAPEWQLSNLTKVLAGQVDFVMLDGNHQADYLRKEVEVCTRLLRPGGVLFLDDVCDAWINLKREFESLKNLIDFDSDMIGTRTGVLCKK